MDSPFIRSSRTSRSPPPLPQKRLTEGAEGPTKIEAVSTHEIQQWLSSIEQCLNEICTISGESKMNTEQKLKISTVSRNVMGGVSQLAVQYQSLKQKYITAQMTIKTLTDQKETSTQLDDQLEVIKECIRSAPKAQTPSTSFADVVRTRNSSVIRPPSTSTIAIYPASKDKSSEDTKKLIQAIIKPEELKLHIRGMRKTKSGGIIISAEGKDDLEKLKHSETLKSSGLQVEETTKRRPKIILLGVPATTSEKDLFECLYEQNISDKHQNLGREKFLNSIKLSHKSDSSFMYVIAVLCTVKLYQSRHADVNASAHATFMLLAVVMAIGLFGIMYASVYFWAAFTALHLATCLVLTLKIYYFGQFRIERGVLSRGWLAVRARGRSALRPNYTARAVLLALANAANWALAVYGLYEHNKDFARHLLAILMGNTFLYTCFYVAMKCLHRERIAAHTWLYLAGAVGGWALAIVFFLDARTKWSQTPAQSRQHNAVCSVLQFYDSHDVWHITSAAAMFLYFNMLLTVDDGLKLTPREEIPVF